MLKLFIALFAVFFLSSCKLTDPQPLCEPHIQPDVHSYEAHATCTDEHDEEPEDDDHEEPEDDHGNH